MSLPPHHSLTKGTTVPWSSSRIALTMVPKVPPSCAPPTVDRAVCNRRGLLGYLILQTHEERMRTDEAKGKAEGRRRTASQRRGVSVWAGRAGGAGGERAGGEGEGRGAATNGEPTERSKRMGLLGGSGGKDKDEGAMDKAKGRLKEGGGALTGDKKLKREGSSDQRKGKAKQKKGDLKDLLP